MVKLLRNITNGKLLGQYVDQPVSITGIVSNVNQNGKSFDIRTVDNITVKIELSSPLDDMLDGYVEVHGVSKGTSVVANEYIQFTSEQSKEFDLNSHDQLCNLLHSLPDPFKIKMINHVFM